MIIQIKNIRTKQKEKTKYLLRKKDCSLNIRDIYHNGPECSLLFSLFNFLDKCLLKWVLISDGCLFLTSTKLCLSSHLLIKFRKLFQLIWWNYFNLTLFHRSEGKEIRGKNDQIWKIKKNGQIWQWIGPFEEWNVQ